MLSQMLGSTGTAGTACSAHGSGGAGDTAPQAVRLADRTARPAAPGPDASARAERSWETARRPGATGRVYGRSTGVGAIGAPLPGREVRAMLAVRANQLLASGAGLRPAVVTALAQALESGVHPVVNEHGAVGTGDLAALAQTGLALVGEHPWDLTGAAPDGRAPAPLELDGNDALALDELRRLLSASLTVAALSLIAVGGSLEAYAQPVHEARPLPGSVEAAARMRALLGAPARPTPPLGRIQDPYGFRCLPQIHGPALDAADALERVLTVEFNAAAENPLICAEDEAAHHHGNFCAAHLALGLDHFRLATLQTARLSTARLAALSEPDFTRLRPFLGHAVLSRGVEEQAGFASLGARQTLRVIDNYRQVLGCELVAAVRALRRRGLEPEPELPVGAAFALAAAELDPRMEDRPLTQDVAVAAGLLDGLADLSVAGT